MRITHRTKRGAWQVGGGEGAWRTQERTKFSGKFSLKAEEQGRGRERVSG